MKMKIENREKKVLTNLTNEKLSLFDLGISEFRTVWVLRIQNRTSWKLEENQLIEFGTFMFWNLTDSHYREHEPGSGECGDGKVYNENENWKLLPLKIF